MFETSWVRIHPRPIDVYRKAEAYFHSVPSRPKDPAYTAAVAATRRDYHIPKVRPYHINDSMRYFQHPDKSPGLPFTLMGYRRKDEVDPILIKQYVRLIKTGSWTSARHPCNLIARSMVARHPKCRLIWVYPAYMTFMEGMFAQPLIKQYISKKGSYAQWVQFAKGDMAVLQSRLPRGMRWLGIDFQAYDSTIPPWLIRDAFKILEDRIDFSLYHGYGAPADPEYLRRCWRAIIRYFIDTPFTIPGSGKVWKKHLGVPSGSYFTSLINSVCNSIIMHYVLRACRYSLALST